MKKTIRTIMGILVVCSMTSCATLFDGGSPKVTVASNSIPANTPVTITTENNVYRDVTLPCRVKVKRHKIDGQRIQVSTGQKQYPDIILEKKVNSWTWGNILIGGVIGWGVDLITNCVSKPSKSVVYVNDTPTQSY